MSRQCSRETKPNIEYDANMAATTGGITNHMELA